MLKARRKATPAPAPDPSEHHRQAKLIGILAYRLKPEVVCMAIPNGDARAWQAALRLKAEGVLPGAPDLVFAYSVGMGIKPPRFTTNEVIARTLWLEMKRGNSGRLSDHQLGVRAKLHRLGHDWEMARTVDEALDILERYGLLQ